MGFLNRFVVHFFGINLDDNNNDAHEDDHASKKREVFLAIHLGSITSQNSVVQFIGWGWWGRGSGGGREF